MVRCGQQAGGGAHQDVARTDGEIASEGATATNERHIVERVDGVQVSDGVRAYRPCAPNMRGLVRRTSYR